MENAGGEQRRLEICLFGPFDARTGDASLASLLSRRARDLLALLILRSHRAVERSWLAGTLWPESAERQALSNLRENLSDLRRALGREADCLRSPTPRTLLLDLAGATVDVICAVARGDLASLEQAIRLYRGPLLEGCLEEWALQERAAREQAYLGALETLATHVLTQKEYAAAAEHLRKAVMVDPLRESARRGLMRALVADGQYAAAIQVYRELRQYLFRELQTEPDSETTALFQQIRAEARAQVPVRTPAPQKASAEEQKPRLPAQFTRFFGREEEITRLEALLSPSSRKARASRLITLTGPGGSGKTRLAVEAAEQIAEDFFGAVWFVPLADLADPRLISGTVAEVLALSRSPNVDPLDQVVAFLNARSAPALLVLDNFEHLLAAERHESEDGALLVRLLLERAPRLTCLITSRQRLNLEGEREFAVFPLPTPGQGGAERAASRSLNGRLIPPVQNLAPDALLAFPSIQLFVDRVLAVRPDFQVTASNASDVAELCERLEGIPLAIELAAVRAQVLTPGEMVSQLRHRFEFLVSRKRDARERHRSLRAAIEWSYRLLTPELQRFFARLSVFRGGWTAATAEAIGEEPQALDYLAQLRECSLILSEYKGSGTRFRMVETLREYAWEQLTEEERGHLQRRHADRFLALAEEGGPHIRIMSGAEWLERLETEHDNLRAALGWSVGAGGSVGHGLRLASALHSFWMVRGYLSEGREWMSRALMVDKGADATARARALLGAGVLAWSQGDYAQARAFYEESLTLARELGDKRHIAPPLQCLGQIALEQGDPVAARTLLKESLVLYREMGNRRQIARALPLLGDLALDQGDPAAAHTLYEESQAIWRDLGDRWGSAYSLHNLGKVAREQGNYAKARALYEEGLVILRELGHWRAIAVSQGYLGMIAFEQGDYAEARALLEDSLAMARALGDRQCIAYSLAGIASVTAAQGEPGAAARLWGMAERLREEIGSPVAPNERHRYEKQVAAARACMADDAAFDVAWQAGRTMTLKSGDNLPAASGF